MATDFSQLPARFAALAPLAAHWARPTENQRGAIRWSATAADFATFYEAMMPRLEEILSHLATQPPHAMPASEQNLFNLLRAFAEAAPHHELYGGSSSVPHSFDARRFVPLHGDTES